MGPASAIAVILVLVGLALALLLRRLGGGSRPTASWKEPDMATTLTTGTDQPTGAPTPPSAAPARRQPAAAATGSAAGRLALAGRS